ncbi:MAG: PKD domain-containing protein, partial [Bacteroidia bacterium]
LTATATPVNCSGQCTGTASVSAVTGGDGIYTYSWSPGGNTTNSVSALCAGTYSVTASNAKCGTSVTQTVSVIAPPALTLTPTPTNPTSCGATNGSVSLAASGGTATYSYNINGGAYGASTNFTGLGAGTYTMGVKDSKGCTLTATVTLTNGAGPTVTVNSPTICSGNSTVLTASGATTYSWSPATGLSTTTGANPTANPTVTTTYTVVGTTSTCTASATSVVTITPPPTVTVASATVCPGASTTLSASGASTYTWAPTGSLSSSTGSTVTATPASTTVYTITGTSAASCTSTTTATVTIGSGITPTVPSATICNGSSTTLNASGGTTYTWSPATGLSATTGTSVIASPASTTTYTINAATGACTGTTTAVVTVNPLPPVTVNSPSVCIGGNATLTANGATTYSWSPAAGLSATTGANVTANPTVTTTYTVVGTTSSCTAQATSTVTINPLPTVTSTSASICPGGTGTITASGASTYSWNTGATTATISDNPAVTTNYTVTGTSAAGCVNSATTTINVLAGISITPPSATICVNGSATLTASGATSYTWSPATGLSSTNGASVVSNNTVSTTYTITGSTGTCSATATATLVVNPLPPVAVNGATICAGQQTATLTAVGATSYNWNPSTGLSSSSGGSVTATPATTTSYTVTGTDGNGCVNTATTTVTVNPLPTITVVSTTICPTSTGTLTASGASTYTWNTGATGPSFTDSPVVTTTYTVAGTDANGCFAGNTGTITINPSIVVTAGNNTPICAGGTINLTTTSGTVWSWTGPGGYASSSQNPTIINATTSMSGTYSLTATDASGCQGSTTTNVIVNPLPVLSIGSNGPICVNQTLNLTSGGGSSYSWNGPGGFTSAQQNPTITGVTATAGGVYTVTVTDGNTCVNTTTLNVVVNPLPVVGVTGSTVCVNGTINLGSTGGAGYSWSWSGPGGYASNQQFPSISPATLADAGTYVVTVTDSKNCVNANAAQVVVNSLPIVSVTTAQICAGTSTSLSASGASTYVWSPTTGLSSSVSSAPVCSPAVTTAYTVTGTDVKGCQSTATTTVVVTPAPAAVITPSITTGCAPVCTGFTNVDTTNASLNTYSWNFGNGQTSSSVAPTSCYNVAGNYTVSLTVTNSIGCKGVSTATVVVYPVPNADFYATPQPTTILDNQIHFYDQTTGGATITTWNWTLAPGIHSTVQNPTMLYGDTGTFVVELVVTSNRGCKDSVIKTIRIDDEFSLYVPNAFSPNGDGVNDIFYAKGEGVRDFKMWIFDRWGNQAFFSDDIYKGWDGRCRAKGSEIVQEDVYVWKIQCRTPKGEKKQLSGHVSLIK